MVISFDYDDSGAGFNMFNGGIGPAIIRSFTVYVDGKPKKNWHEVSESIGVQKPYTWFIRVPSPNSSWTPSEPKKIYWVSAPQATQILKANQSRISVAVCYCSLYGECWFRTNTVIEPQPNSCDIDLPPKVSETAN